MATLYRCKTPTDFLCPCGKVARRLRSNGIDFDEVRVRSLKRHRPEIAELTGQRWVPVLVHGEAVIHDSHRILQYLEAAGRPGAAGESPSATESSAGEELSATKGRTTAGG
jgi:glutaredoxin 3